MSFTRVMLRTGLTNAVSQPLTAFLDPKNKDSDNDTLITTGEVYHQYVRADVKFREVGQ